jgi:hypothetical protein
MSKRLLLKLSGFIGAALLTACATSHTYSPDGSGRRDGSVRRDGGFPDASPPPDVGTGLSCGSDFCSPTEICCDACGGPPFFCSPMSAGCPVPTCPPPPPGGDVYVIDSLQVGAADPAGDPNIVPGMNLDGRVSDGLDFEGCLHQDFVSPPPDNEPGVDNQMGPILSAVGSSLDFSFDRAIASGEWLILIVVHDDGRTITLHRGVTADGAPPRVTRGGRLEPGQVFHVRETLGGLSAESGGRRTRTTASTIVFPLHPLSRLSIRFQSARLYGDFTREGIERGVIGGSYGVDEAVDQIVAIDPDTIPPALARSVLQAQADMEQTPSGECTRVSAGFTFAAVPAFLE